MNPQNFEQIKEELRRTKSTLGDKNYQMLFNNSSVKNKSIKPEEDVKRTGAGSILPGAFAVGGGILGGFAGAPAGPAGVVGGGVAGAAAGGALGETIQQGIESKFGQRENIDHSQILESGVFSGVAQGVVPAGGVIFKGVSTISRPLVVKTMSKISGFTEPVLEKLLSRTPGVVSGLREGENALLSMIQRSASGISKYADETLSKSKQLIASLSQSSKGIADDIKKILVPQKKTVPLPNLPFEIAKNIKGQTTNFISSITNTLRSKYNIGVNKTGELVFDRPNIPSNIVNSGDKNAIQEAFRAVNNITKNLSIKNIDAVLERLIVLRKKTPGGTPTGAETKKIIGTIMDDVVKFVESLGNVGIKQYSQYATHLKEALPERLFINQMKDLFGGKSQLSPKEASKVARDILRLFNPGGLAVRESAEKIGGEIGEDIVGTSAGVIAQTGKQVGQNVPMSLPDIGRQVFQFVPNQIIKNFARTGRVTGDLVEMKALQLISKITGYSIRALLQSAVEQDKEKR